MSPDRVRVQPTSIVLGWKTAAAIVVVLVVAPVRMVQYLEGRFDTLEQQIAQRPTNADLQELRTAVLEMQIIDRVLDVGIPASGR